MKLLSQSLRTYIALSPFIAVALIVGSVPFVLILGFASDSGGIPGIMMIGTLIGWLYMALALCAGLCVLAGWPYLIYRHTNRLRIGIGYSVGLVLCVPSILQEQFHLLRGSELVLLLGVLGLLSGLCLLALVGVVLAIRESS